MKCQNIKTVIDTAARREPMSEMVKFHLGGCPDCRQYADGTSALLALLRTQPRVEAPADFDFKLRARIARAQAEPQGSLAFLERLWSRSFSWGQAATAVATVALAITITTIQLNRNDQTSPSPANLALTAVQVPQVSSPMGSEASPASVEALTPAPIAKAVRLNSRSARSYSISERVGAADPGESRQIIASSLAKGSTPNSDDTWRAYNPEKGQIAVPNRATYFGVENSSGGLAKTAAFVPSI